MENKFDLSWDDVALQSNTNKVNYLKVEPGKIGARIRIASNASIFSSHWAAINGKMQKQNCAGADCLLCKAGSKAQRRKYFYVLDKTEDVDNPQLKVYECPSAVWNTISALVSDKDYGNPTGYDIKIKREGNGTDTKYSAIPGAITPMTEKEIALAKSATPLAEVLKAGTNEEIINRGFDLIKNAQSAASTAVTAEKTVSASEAPTTSAKPSEDDWGF